MKVIVIGTSLSGKTTIIKELRKFVTSPISEIDEDLTDMNDGKYPSDSNYKNQVLAPQIIKDILNKNDILFFTNTDYFRLEDLKKAKKSDFKIIQINVDYEELLKRNANRIKNEGYEDSSKWLKGMINYQEKIQEKGLVDKIIDGNQSTSQIVGQLRRVLNI